MEAPRRWTKEGIAALYKVEDDAGVILWEGPAAELREIVLACGEAAQKLTEPPLDYRSHVFKPAPPIEYDDGTIVERKQMESTPDPSTWSGYVPPRIWGHQRNSSPQRRALLEIVRLALYHRQKQAGAA